MKSKIKNIQQLFDFIRELEKLKTVQRQNKTLDTNRFENSAEHSWHVAMMALVLKEYLFKNIDMFKVIKMLLIHDIAEIDTGDTFLYDDEKKKSSVSKEEKAANRIFGILPPPFNDNFFYLWKEFEEQSTPEAKCAAVMDGLQPLLNHVITRSKNENPQNMKKSKVIEKKKFIGTVSPDLWNVALELIEEGVEKGLYRDL